MEIPDRLAGLTVSAWVGEDELGSRVVGLKQGLVPAGMIPLVSIIERKISNPDVFRQMQAQAEQWGKKIYLVRFTLTEVIDATENGEPLK